MSTPLERAAEAIDVLRQRTFGRACDSDVARAALEAAIDEGELVAFLKRWRLNGRIGNAEFASMLKAHLLGGAE